MKYYLNKTIALDIESSTIKMTNELKTEGFGIVTQFDVNKALKEKLDIDFRPYRIMGACNPAFAFRSINAEDKIGTLLPCNIMLQETSQGTEIAVINPKSMISEIENDEMKTIANEIYEKLQRVVNNI